MLGVNILVVRERAFLLASITVQPVEEMSKPATIPVRMMKCMDSDFLQQVPDGQPVGVDAGSVDDPHFCAQTGIRKRTKFDATT